MNSYLNIALCSWNQELFKEKKKNKLKMHSNLMNTALQDNLTWLHRGQKYLNRSGEAINTWGDPRFPPQLSGGWLLHWVLENATLLNRLTWEREKLQQVKDGAVELYCRVYQEHSFSYRCYTQRKQINTVFLHALHHFIWGWIKFSCKPSYMIGSKYTLNSKSIWNFKNLLPCLSIFVLRYVIICLKAAGNCSSNVT